MALAKLKYQTHSVDMCYEDELKLSHAEGVRWRNIANNTLSAFSSGMGLRFGENGFHRIGLPLKIHLLAIFILMNKAGEAITQSHSANAAA